MPIFAFYGFKVSKQKDEEELFKEQEEENGKQLAQYDSPEACFGSFFKTGGKLSLNVLKEKGKGMDKIREWEPYENDVLMVADGVIFLYKKGVYRTYDLKTVFGKSSVGSSLIDSIEQCNRVLLNIQLDYNTRSLAFDIKRYFEINEKKAVKVLIFNGKQICKQRIKISGIKVLSHMVGHEWTAVTPEKFIKSV